MDFVIRPLEERDLPACVELLRGHLAYPAPILRELPKVWRRLLREDALVAIVVESEGLEGKPGTIHAFGVAVFVTDDWFDLQMPEIPAPVVFDDMERIAMRAGKNKAHHP